MPEIILKNSNNSSQIITSTEKKAEPAKWFAEVVLISQLCVAAQEHKTEYPRRVMRRNGTENRVKEIN